MAITAAQLDVRFNAQGVPQTKSAIDSVGAAVNNAGKATQGFWSNALSAGLGFVGANLFGQLTSSIGGFLTAGIDFEHQMSAIQAVTGATGAEFDALGDLALQIGKDTSFGAGEAAFAIEELAKAGISTENILKGAATATTALAAAGGVDLATAATVMSNAMNQFGIAGTDAARVADVLAAASAISSTGVTELGESLKYVGTTANMLGIDLETTTAALAVLADQGLVGSTAGTSLNNMLLSMSDASVRAADEMNALGLSFFNLDGTMKPLEQIINDVAMATSGLTEEQKAQYMEAIFGQEGMRAMNALLATQTATAKEAGKSWQDYYAGVTQSGAAAEQAAARMNNFSADMDALKGSIETAAIMLMMTFLPSLRGLAQGATGVVNGFVRVIGIFAELEGMNPFEKLMFALRTVLKENFAGKWVVPVLKAMNRFEDVMTRVGGAVQRVAGFLRSVLGVALEFVTRHMDIVTTVLGGFLTGWLALIAAGAVVAVFMAIGAALAALLSPIALVIAAITALGMAWNANLFGIQDIVASVFGAIGDFFDSLADTVMLGTLMFQNLRDLGLSPVQAAVETLVAILPGLEGHIRAVGDVVQHVVDAFQAFTAGNFAEGFTQLGQAALDLGRALLSGFLAIPWGEIGSFLLSGLQSALSFLANIGGDIFNWLVGAVRSINWSAVWGVIESAGSYVIDAFGDLWTFLTKWFTDAIGQISWSSVWASASAMGDKVVAAFGDAWTAIYTWITSAISRIDWASAWATAANMGLTLVESLTDISFQIAAWVQEQIDGVDWAAVGSNIAGKFTSMLQSIWGAGGGGTSAAISSIATNIMDWVTTQIESVDWNQAGAKFGELLVTAIKGFFAVGAALAGLAGSLLGALLVTLVELDWAAVGSSFLALFVAAIVALTGFFVGLATKLFDELKAAIGEVDWSLVALEVKTLFKTAVVGAAGWFTDLAVTLFNELVTAIGEIDWAAVGEKIKDKFLDGVKGVGTAVGTALMDEFWNSTNENGDGGPPASGGHPNTPRDPWAEGTLGSGSSGTMTGNNGQQTEVNLLPRSGSGPGGMFAGILQQIQALVTAVTTARTTIETETTAINTAFVNLGPTMGTAIQAILTAITGVFVTAIPAVILTGMTTATTTIGTETTNWGTTAGLNIQAILTAVTAVFVTAIPAVILEGMLASSTTITSETAAWATTFTTETTSIKTKVEATFNDIASKIKDKMGESASDIRSKMSEAAREVDSRTRDMLTDVRTVMTDIARIGDDKARDFARAINDGFQDAVRNVSNALDDIRGEVSGFDLYDDGYGIGQNFSQGILNGIGSLIWSIAAEAARVVNAAIDAANNAAGNASPSKVMRQSGQWFSEGLRLGILDIGPQVARAAADVMTGAIASASRVQIPDAVGKISDAITKPMLKGVEFAIGPGPLPVSSEHVTYIPAPSRTPTSTTTNNVTFQPGAIVQQPGEDGAALASRVLQELRDATGSRR
jgi:TP901 family phage tail tape measure protein